MVVFFDIDKSSVEFAEKRSVQAVQYGDNDVGPSDDLAHAKDAGVCLQRGGAKPVKEQLIERDRLCIEIEYGVGMNGKVGMRRRSCCGRINFDFLDRSVNRFVVNAGTPGAVL